LAEPTGIITTSQLHSSYLSRARISEFESSQPSHAVGSPRAEIIPTIYHPGTVLFAPQSGHTDLAQLRSPVHPVCWRCCWQSFARHGRKDSPHRRASIASRHRQQPHRGRNGARSVGQISIAEIAFAANARPDHLPTGIDPLSCGRRRVVRPSSDVSARVGYGKNAPGSGSQTGIFHDRAHCRYRLRGRCWRRNRGNAADLGLALDRLGLAVDLSRAGLGGAFFCNASPHLRQKIWH
jgi:hypothetical protein